MVTAIMAEVAYPILPEIGVPKVGALILGAGEVPGSKREKLEKLLPPGADLWYRKGTLRIEIDVPPGQRGKMSIHKLAKTIRSAISKSLGVRAGLCPVASSAKVLELVRKG